MATILNIETSTDVCSVALTADGYILCHREDFDGPNHAALLSGFIADCLDFAKQHDGMKIDAVAVSIGPGSYTGLRIGLSEAKGLAYGLNVPLIGIDTLKVIAVEAMFNWDEFDPETDVFVPMIDARRDEVYMAVYDGLLQELEPPHAEILETDTFEGKFSGKRRIFAGNGATKASRILNNVSSGNGVFLSEIKPLATTMLPLSEKNFAEKNFIDVAYSVPLYVKEFMATVPKKRF